MNESIWFLTEEGAFRNTHALASTALCRITSHIFVTELGICATGHPTTIWLCSKIELIRLIITMAIYQWIKAVYIDVMVF